MCPVNGTMKCKKLIQSDSQCEDLHSINNGEPYFLGEIPIENQFNWIQLVLLVQLNWELVTGFELV